MSRHMRPLSNRLLYLRAEPSRRTFTALPSEPSSLPKPILTHDETLSSLKIVDDELLAALQRHFTEHSNKARKIESIVSDIQASAAQVQLDPQLPPYTVLAWKKEVQLLPKQLEMLQEAIDKAVLNVKDLQCIDYPADSRRSESEELRRLFIEGKLGGREQQKEQLRNFQNEEEALKGRLRKRIERMRNELEQSRSRAMIGKAVGQPSFALSGSANPGPDTIAAAPEDKSAETNQKRKSLKQAVEEGRKADQKAPVKKTEQKASEKKSGATDVKTEIVKPSPASHHAESTFKKESPAPSSRSKDLPTLAKDLATKYNTAPAAKGDAAEDTSNSNEGMIAKESFKPSDGGTAKNTSKPKEGMTVKEKVLKVKESLVEKEEGSPFIRRVSGLGGKKAETAAQEEPKHRMSLFERNKLLSERMKK